MNSVLWWEFAIMKKMLLVLFAFALVYLAGALPFADAQAPAQEKRRTGTLSGVVTDKGESKDGRNGWVEVKADGEEKGRKYWPVAAVKGGGPDRDILKAIREVAVGARVRLEWVDAGDGKDISKFEVLKKEK
jgi:hypothetical protein